MNNLLKYYTCVIICFLNFVPKTFGQSAYQVQVNAPSIGNPCPNYKFYTLDHTGLKKDSISAYRGQVLVLEFWATNCRPCIPAMDNFEIMEAGFGKQMKVLEITNEDRNKVEHFLTKHPSGTSIVLDLDNKLNTAFYHHLIPHTVLIDPQGIVRAFTSPEQVSSNVIRQLLNNQEISIKPKHEYDPNAKPIDSDLSRALDNAAQSVFQSDTPNTTQIATPKTETSTAIMLLSQHQAGLSSEIRWESDRHVKFINCPLTVIYQSLFDVPNSHVVLEVPSENLLKYSYEDKNSYCLELAIPKFMDKTLAQFGQQQLATMFDLKAKLTTCEREVYVIQDENFIEKSNPNSKSTLKDLINFLENLPSNYGTPVINESTLPSQSPIDLDWFATNTETIENKLLSLGLKRTKKKITMECLILYEKTDIGLRNE